MHGVRRDHQEVRSRRLEPPRGLGQERARPLPVARVLKSFDLMEIHAEEKDLRGMEPAERARDGLIDDAVVRERGLPAHTAEQADCFQGILLRITEALSVALSFARHYGRLRNAVQTRLRTRSSSR